MDLSISVSHKSLPQHRLLTLSDPVNWEWDKERETAEALNHEQKIKILFLVSAF